MLPKSSHAYFKTRGLTYAALLEAFKWFLNTTRDEVFVTEGF